MKRYFFLLLSIFLSLSLYAQDVDNTYLTYDTIYVADTLPINASRKGHYIVASIGGGLNGLALSIEDNGTNKQGLGISANVGYRYFFTPHIGVGIGINFSTFSSTSTLNYIQNESNETDERAVGSLDDAYRQRDYQTVFDNLKEKNTLSLIKIPVGIYYQQKIGNKFRFSLGGKVSVANILNEKFKTTKGELKNTAYYPEPRLTIDNLPEYGFNTYTKLKGTPDLKKTAIGIGGIVELHYPITKQFDITFGVDGTYFMSDLKNTNQPKLWDTQTDTYYGVAQTDYCTNIKLTSVTANIGIRYRIAQKPKPIIKEILPPTPQDSTFDNVANIDSNKNENYNRNADNYDINIIPQDYTFVNTGLELNKQLSKLKIGEPIGTPIHFALNSDQLADTINSMIDTVVLFLKENPIVLKLEIAAHTDNLGTDAYNLRLSKRRANTVVKYMIKQGIDPKRLVPIGYGESKPLNDNGDERKQEINRRVEFILLELDN